MFGMSLPLWEATERGSVLLLNGVLCVLWPNSTKAYASDAREANFNNMKDLLVEGMIH